MQIKYTKEKPIVKEDWWRTNQIEEHLAEHSGMIHMVWTGLVGERASLAMIHRWANSSNTTKAILYLDYRGNTINPGYDNMPFNLS